MRHLPRCLVGLPTAIFLAPRKVDRLLQHPRAPLQGGRVLVGGRVAPNWPRSENAGRSERANPAVRLSCAGPIRRMVHVISQPFSLRLVA